MYMCLKDMYTDTLAFDIASRTGKGPHGKGNTNTCKALLAQLYKQDTEGGPSDDKAWLSTYA